jgi:hypothetical protein
MPLQIEVTAVIIGMLIETEYLTERDSADRAKVAAAIVRMLTDAAAPR